MPPKPRLILASTSPSRAAISARLCRLELGLVAKTCSLRHASSHPIRRSNYNNPNRRVSTPYSCFSSWRQRSKGPRATEKCGQNNEGFARLKIWLRRKETKEILRALQTEIAWADLQLARPEMNSYLTTNSPAVFCQRILDTQEPPESLPQISVDEALQLLNKGKP